jgi:ATP-grasp domain
MSRLGLRVHLLTQEPAESDPRYASVRRLEPGLNVEDLAALVLERLRATSSSFAVTFQETDIAAVGLANERHGVGWARPEADATARDKSRQRRHMIAHDLPTPAFLEVRDHREALDQLTSTGADAWPVIIKPTHAAGSSHVRLVRDRAEASAALHSIHELAHSRLHNFYDQTPEVWALVEEYLSGDEVTCDGVVIDGTFHLGGIHTKELGEEPWFEEDLYTLPFTDHAAEEQIVDIASRLACTLDLQHCLLNLELRRDGAGAFRIVEFSTRISGGHVYRNILDVHAVDLVELFLLAALGDAATAEARAGQRHPGRLASCIRMVYRTGTVATNHAGTAATDPQFRAYYALAEPGTHVASAPAGFDICGLLSVRGHFVPDQHPALIHAAARRLELELGLRLHDDALPHRLQIV